MPVGKPIYKIDDKVSFEIEREGEKVRIEGTVAIVDGYGIFGDNTKAYYDVMGDEPNRIFFKHIPEEMLERV